MLSELFMDREVVGKYVRVTGFVQSMDLAQGICHIVHGDYNLTVDLSLVGAEGLSVDSLMQFIGEVRAGTERGMPPAPTGQPSFFLQAKIKRCVDGLDLRLYEESLKARRAFLQDAH